MGSPELVHDISPIPRSREENQERAFIAASRRKDRSLDARLESANRASMLHKKRTGKAFHITKEIVEKEAMYEEVDERYQEKRIRMLQAQNMQIEEQFHRHLLAAFARASGSGSASSSIASRRTSMSARGSIDCNARKMSLDLSNLHSAFPQDTESGSLTSPIFPASDGYVLSPSSAAFDPGPQSSYMSCMDGSDASYNFIASSAAPTTTSATTASAQIPAYVTQPTPVWTSQVPWGSMQTQQMPTPSQTPTDSTAVHLWQQQMMQQSQMPAHMASAVHMRQFRERLASAPELPVQQAVPPPPPHMGSSISGHSRGSSQPGNSFHNLRLLTQGTHLASSSGSQQMMPSHSSDSSPHVEEIWSAESKSTPDFCPTPNTPLSPTTRATMHAPPPVTAKETESGIMVSSHEAMGDPDYNEFSQFALGLGNASHPHHPHHPHHHLQDREQYGFDDLVALDDLAAVSC